MNGRLAEIEMMLLRIEHLAEELRADPDGHVRRSVEELRAAFVAREAVEPAVARLRESMAMLSTENRGGTRREYQRRAPGLDHLAGVVDDELLPYLRGIGFNV